MLFKLDTSTLLGNLINQTEQFKYMQNLDNNTKLLPSNLAYFKRLFFMKISKVNSLSRNNYKNMYKTKINKCVVIV